MNQSKSPKVVKPTNKKRYYKTLWTSVINNPMSPPSLYINSVIHKYSIKKVWDVFLGTIRYIWTEPIEI